MIRHFKREIDFLSLNLLNSKTYVPRMQSNIKLKKRNRNKMLMSRIRDNYNV